MAPLKRIVFVVLITLLLPASAFPQARGRITGRVMDQTEAVIPGVAVSLLQMGATEHIEIITEADGSYRFDNVLPGPAEVTFRLINFNTARRTVAVAADGTATVDVVLTISASADITITSVIRAALKSDLRAVASAWRSRISITRIRGSHWIRMSLSPERGFWNFRKVRISFQAL